MQLLDVFAVMEGQARPTEEEDGRGEDEETDGSTAPLLTCLLYTAGGALSRRQAGFDRVNMNLNTILYLVTDKAVALVVATRGYDERGIRHNGQRVKKELEDLHVTNETIRALQAALTAISTEPDEDPYTYIMKANRLRNKLTAVEEPVTDRHFTDTIVQGLPRTTAEPSSPPIRTQNMIMRKSRTSRYAPSTLL